MIRRDISVDFSIPPDYPSYRPGPDGRETYFVPVHLLRKWPPVIRLDLRDRADRAIPLLTSSKNRQVDAAALLGIAPAGPILDAVRADLKMVATSGPKEAWDALQRVGAGVFRQADDLTLGGRQRWMQLFLVGSVLGRNSLVWAQVDAYPRERQLVKIRFEYPFDSGFDLARRFFVAMSWAPQRARVLVPNIGDGTSYHLQFEPPPGTVVHRARLRLNDPRMRAQAPPGRPSVVTRLSFSRTYAWRLANTIRRRVRSLAEPLEGNDQYRPSERFEWERPPSPGEPYAWATRHRAYLYVSGPRDHYGAAEIDMAPEKAGLLSGAVAMAVAIAALLTFLAVGASTIVANVAPAVTTLLFAPALLGYLVARPVGEHAIRRSQVAGVRVTLMLIGALPVLAALALLAAGDTPNPDVVRPWWVASAIASWVLALVLVSSALLPLIKDPPPGTEMPDWAQPPKGRAGPAQ